MFLNFFREKNNATHKGAWMIMALGFLIATLDTGKQSNSLEILKKII